MARYGMVVDLNRCVGCQTCTIACKSTNDTPPGIQWRRVIDVEHGRFPDVQRLFLVTGCQHCAKPSCVPVCPTGATRQRADGLVTIDYDLCIGCAACAVACPYQARFIAHKDDGYYGERTAHEQATAHEDRFGVATKCTFCVERIDVAAVTGLVPSVDPEVTPACAASCITQAIHFGDFENPQSEVSTIAATQKTFQIHAELGNDPYIKYLYEVSPSMPGREADARDTEDERMSDPANPLVGKRQTLWDYRAAMNFILGGMSSGLALMAWLAHLADMIDGAALRAIHVSAAALMAAGLFFVFLKIGRKARFLNVLRVPTTSWMSRETWCVAAFYPAVAANLLWPHPVLDAVAALGAAGFLLSQARIVYASKGIPTWRAPLVPWILVATGLFEGLSLLTLAILGMGLSTTSLAGAGVALALVNALLWWRYRASAKANGIGPLSRREISRVTGVLHVVGHAAPALLFALAGAIGSAAFAGAAACALAGGALLKFVLITRACHQQGFALPMLPQRGSGTRAAPARYTCRQVA